MIGFFLPLLIAAPLFLAGAFHLLLPTSAWSFYCRWGGLWGSDPEKIDPDYNWRQAMLCVGGVLLFAGSALSLIALIPR